MAKLVGEVIRDVRARLHEPYEARWSDRDLRQWLNEGQREIATRFRWYRKSDTVNAVAGTQSYSLPSDAMMIYSVQYTPTGTSLTYPVEFCDRRVVASEAYTWLGTHQSQPALYWTEGYPGTTTFKIWLYPIPSAAGTFRIDYYGVPADWSLTGSDDDDNILVPNGFESLVVDYVTYQAKLSDRDPDWQSYNAMYEKNLAAFEEVITQTGAMSVGQIAPNSSAGYDEWMW